MFDYRIRRCNGNRDCWMIVFLRDDQTEIEVYTSGCTSYSIDRLLAANVNLIAGKRGELITDMPK